MKTSFNLIATSTFGLESVLADELKALGFQDLKTANGKIEFQGGLEDIARCNLWLRTADRVLIKLAEFKAVTFDELFDQTYELEWDNWLTPEAKIHVNGRSLKSQLFSISDCQAIVKKSIIEKLKTKYPREYFPEDGPLFKLEIAMNQDIATITLDSSGPGLHKRGYRQLAGQAPLKETMAAGLVYLTKWKPHRLLIDPCCGSGTLLIEAALIANNIAPGLYREFAAQEWPWFTPEIWSNARAEAKSAQIQNDFKLLGSDISGKVLKQARDNAQQAQVDHLIAFQKLPLKEVSSKKKYGVILCNPPYGERLTQADIDLQQDFKSLIERLDTWSFFIFTATENFEKLMGKKANKRRKLYNGNIKCQFYQYFGPLPPRKGARNEEYRSED